MNRIVPGRHLISGCVSEISRASSELLDVQLSIVIPCRNAADTLPDQLRALSQQDWSGRWEIVLVDDASSDGSGDLALRLACELGLRLKVLQVRANSAAQARNEGVKAASGQWIAFVDADDVVAPGWLSAMAAALEHHSYVVGHLDVRRLNSERAIQRAFGEQDDIGASHPVRPFAPVGNSAIHRSLHEAVHGFNAELVALEDVDYSWKLQDAGAKIHRVREAVVFYRLRGTFAGQCRKAWREGQAEPLLFKLHAVPIPDDFALLRSLAWLVVAPWRAVLRLLLSRTGNWQEFAVGWTWRAGRLYGCIRHGYVRLAGRAPRYETRARARRFATWPSARPEAGV